jgi:hypothetical protein
LENGRPADIRLIESCDAAYRAARAGFSGRSSEMRSTDARDPDFNP